MKMNVLSVAVTEFKDKQTGEKTVMNEVYCADVNGRVGKLYSQKSIKAGDAVEVVLTVRDGRFVCKIA